MYVSQSLLHGNWFLFKKYGNVGNRVYTSESTWHVCFWCESPQWARASSFTRFLDHTHNDAPQTIWLLWTNDQLVAETSTWQYTTLTTDTHPCPRWDWNLQSQQANSHWNRLHGMYLSILVSDAHLPRGVHTYFAREHLCAGDLVLKWKSKSARMSVRESNVSARYFSNSRSYGKTPADS